MGPYSLEATPFRWMMREEAKQYAAVWGIEYDEALEERADELMGWKPSWLQDHRNQLALLDSFFSGVEPGRSLALIYVKDLPLVEERPPGFRALGAWSRAQHSARISKRIPPSVPSAARSTRACWRRPQ
jgi:hypothetical protein